MMPRKSRNRILRFPLFPEYSTQNNFCFFIKSMKNIESLRDGNHKSVLVLIPGTMEQIQAENLALKELMRNMQMGEGGARIKIPECPVIVNLSSNIFEFRCVLKRWHLRSKSSNVSMATLCVDHAGLAFRHKALLFPFIS